MAKKDYVALAKILASHKSSIPTDTFNDLVADVCGMCKADNPRFDDLRFCNAAKG